MKNALYVDYENRMIVMTSTFAKKSRDTHSAEYAHLQEVRRDYPEYRVMTRQIKSNPNMEHYRGLTYEYMKEYIHSHESKETLPDALHEFEEMITLSKCHSIRYPVIKQWFIRKYPEITQYGMPKEKEAEAVELPLAS